MKNPAVVLVFLAWFAAPASADLDIGVAAYNRGDYATALRELKPLAENGLAPAQFNLGVMYNFGEGVPQDYKEALRWYRLAAEQGDALAQFNLGDMYYFGKGVPLDDKEALRWYRLAAEQGHPRAQFIVGSRYATGDGVRKDYVQAYMWLSLATAQGLKKASDARDMTARQMSQSQIAKAQGLVRKWKPKY